MRYSREALLECIAAARNLARRCRKEAEAEVFKNDPEWQAYMRAEANRHDERADGHAAELEALLRHAVSEVEAA